MRSSPENLFRETDIFQFDDCVFNEVQFKKLLELAVKENHPIFNNQLYDQIDGVTMGSSLGPTLANIFMCTLEHNFLTILGSSTKEPVNYYCWEAFQVVLRFILNLHRNW